MISKDRYRPRAVIAGSSEGIGDAFAQEIARAGINLLLLARREELTLDAGGRSISRRDANGRTL